MPETTARGMSIYNPLNLEYRPDQPTARRGATRFGEYSDMPTGVASNLRQLLIDQDHGINTVEGHVRKWVNDPRANLDTYIADLSEKLGVRSDAPINLRDPKMALGYFMAAQPHESGPTKLSSDDVQKGINMALDNGPAIPGGGVLDKYLNEPPTPAPESQPATAAPAGDAIPKDGVLGKHLGTIEQTSENTPPEAPGWREAFHAGVDHAFRNFYDTIGLGNSPAIQQSDKQYGYERPTEEQYKGKYGESLAAATGDFIGNMLVTAPVTVPTGMAAEGLAARVAAPAIKGLIASSDVAPLTAAQPVVSKLVQTAAGSPTAANALRIAGAGAVGAEQSKLTGGSATLGAIGGAGLGGLGLGASALAPYVSSAMANNPLAKYLPDAALGYLAYRYGGPVLDSIAGVADPVFAAMTGVGAAEAGKRALGMIATKLGPYAPYVGAPAGQITNNVVAPALDPAYSPP